MAHVHHCPDCEKDWECLRRDCEKYAAYLCPECFGAFMIPKCYKASTEDAGSAPREEKIDRSDWAIESRSEKSSLLALERADRLARWGRIWNIDWLSKSRKENC